MNETLAIIITYNRKKILGECLDALITSSVKCDVLIVDNASTDGTKDLVGKYLNDSVGKNELGCKIIYYNIT